MLGRTDSRRRILAFLIVIVVGSAALVARTAYWQIVRGAEMTTLATAQTTLTIEVPSRRGEIYDRTGVVLLATTVDRDRLVAAADQLDAAERRQDEIELTRLLELDEAGVLALREKLASGKPYVILARGIEPDRSERIRQAAIAKRLFGISLEPRSEEHTLNSSHRL